MEEKEITAKLKNCKTVEELKATGKEIGYELSDEEAANRVKRFKETGNDSFTLDCIYNDIYIRLSGIAIFCLNYSPVSYLMRHIGRGVFIT